MLGYLLAGVAGISLGLLGGGGSILTVPILVYVLHIDSKIAVALSLAIVGISALAGVIGHYRNGNINLKLAIVFGGFALPGTFIGAQISRYISGTTQLIIFASIMIIAASFMLRGRKALEESDVKLKEINYPLISISALGVGVITGLIGVGGGFLIVPALMFFTGISIKKAVGTSLFIIAFNSIFGFASYLNIVDVPWVFLGKFTSASVLGILIGTRLVNYIPQALLKRIFAIFLIIMGMMILYKNIYL